MATQTIDPKAYGQALAAVRPRVITTKAEHERVLGEIEKLMSKPQPTREERELYELLMTLTGDYESSAFIRAKGLHPQS